MKPSTETLMAYADGELDAGERAAVEAAMAADPALAREVERHRALRGRLQAAATAVLDEPVPERLLATARGAPMTPPAENVTDLARARAGRNAGAPRRRSLPQWSAMAACLVIGVFLGHQFWRAPDAGPFMTTTDGLVARGPLAEALSTQLSGTPAAGDAVRIVLSFRDPGGGYCRGFVMQDGGGTAGMACRETNDWRVEALARGGGADGGANDNSYRMAAGALPPVLLQAAQARMGEVPPLDAAAEIAARDRGWR